MKKLFSFIRKIKREKIKVGGNLSAVVTGSKGKTKAIRDVSDEHEVATDYDGDELKEIVTKARHTADEEERIHLYQRADRRLIEEAAISPLSYGQHHILLKPWVKSFPISPLRFWFWKNVHLDPH